MLIFVQLSLFSLKSLYIDQKVKTTSIALSAISIRKYSVHLGVLIAPKKFEMYSIFSVIFVFIFQNTAFSLLLGIIHIQLYR